MNTVNILGRMTGIPELAETSAKVPYSRFRVAVDRGYKDSNGNRVCDFINCIAWRQTAQFIHKYFTKGQLIAIVGRLESKNWTSADGTLRFKMEVNVGSAYFAGVNRSEGAAPVPEAPEEDLPMPEDFTADYEILTGDEQLPF